MSTEKSEEKKIENEKKIDIVEVRLPKNENLDSRDQERENFLEWKKDHIQLLVISNNRNDYLSLFKDTKIKGLPLKVDQAMWDEISFSCYEPSVQNPFGLVVELGKKKFGKFLPNSKQNRRRTIQPDFLLIRNKPRGTSHYDYRNLMFGLMYSGIGSVNNLSSLYFCLERALVHAELKKIQKKLGKKNFPLIEQYWHSGGNQICFPPNPYPIVAKIGYCHAGFGKMLVKDSDRLRDLRSVVSLHKQYCTTEPFVTAEYELRLQKIGNNYRAMKKKLISYWKSNSFGVATYEDVQMIGRYKLWLDECSKILGGLDIFALDVLVDKDGKEYILELNGTSIGLGPDHKPEDLKCEKEITIQRIEEKLFGEGKAEEKVDFKVNESEVEVVNLRNKVMEMEKEMEKLKMANKKMNDLLIGKNEKNDKKKKKNILGWF